MKHFTTQEWIDFVNQVATNSKKLEMQKTTSQKPFHKGSPIWLLASIAPPRMIKSHECFEPRYKKMVYIVRDPRDVAISNYHWEMKKGSFDDRFPVARFVPKWMDSEYWPRLGSWSDHITSWLSTC